MSHLTTHLDKIIKALKAHDVHFGVYNSACEELTYTTGDRYKLKGKQKFFKKHGLNLIGSGAYRAIFAYGDDYVIKVQVENDSQHSNEHEKYTYEQALANNSHYFLCPLLKTIEHKKRTFSIFPKIIAQHWDYKLNAFQKAMKRIVRNYYHDSHDNNLGIFHAGFVHLDYAPGWRRMPLINTFRQNHENDWKAYKTDYDTTVKQLTNKLDS